MRQMVVRSLLLLGVLAVVALALALWGMTAYLDTPAGGPARTTIQVKQGATLKPLLDELASRGVLERPRWLYFYARFSEATEIRAGEYELTANDTPRVILQTLREGRIKMESFTVAEGLDRWQVRDLLVAAHWLSAEKFDQLCNDAAFLARHEIPGPTCDGYLFPETYTFARGVAAEIIFAEMFETFRRVAAEVFVDTSAPLALDLRQRATLAAIVEKETGAPEERPRIACVFYNRLTAKTRWRLDTDPTVIYAAKLADPHFDGNLTKEHLRKLDSPYNTYRILGLPPGPIANPGRAALEAVARPEQCKDFFFVSMNNGRHEFCPTLACHNAAVQRWQVDYFQRP
jgi:UPF0755 protein